MNKSEIHGAARWQEALLDRLLPRHCLMCGLFSGRRNLCAGCAADLPRSGRACRQCGLPMPGGQETLCGTCLSTPPPWDAAVAALQYRFPVDQVVRRFKFRRSLACGEILAEEMIRAVEARGADRPDGIVPVPLHRSRLFVRTFNQAELLAYRAGRRLGIPVHASVLLRQRRTRAHSGLDAASRKRNIRGAFRCHLPEEKRGDLRHVALVDDVLTTGATLAECTRVLRRAGVERISVWVSARAP